MPVRVKQRALQSTNAEVERQLEALYRQIMGLLLAWHLPVSVSLKAAESKKGLRIRAKDTRLREGGRRNSWRNLDTPLVCGLLSQIGYVEPPDWTNWIKTSARTPFITIRGAISLQPAPSKHVQFISLGLHPINGEKNGNVLYDEVNRLFTSSSFGHQEEGLADKAASSTIGSKDRRLKRDNFTLKQLKGGGKGVDRWPMFYIRIEMQSAGQDCDQDVEKLGEGTLTDLLKVLGAMITSFLDEHHFRPRAKARTRKRELSRNEDEALTSQRPGVNADTANKTTPKHHRDKFGAWGRVKSGIHVRPYASLAGCQLSKSRGGNLEPTSMHFERSVAAQRSVSASNSHNEPNLTQDEHTVEWMNPLSGTTVLVDARTGIVIDPRLSKRPTSAPSNPKSMASSTITQGHNVKPYKRLTRTAPSPHTTSEAISWSSDLLKTWKNPVFGITEQPIPQVSFDSPSLETSDILHGRRHCCSDTEVQKTFTQSSSSFSAKLSRDTLKEATVIAQVDQKFILASMSHKPDGSVGGQNLRKILVLVDQHAADERIRVEALLSELQSSPTSLAKPITFELSAHENDLLTRQIPYFADWGIICDITLLPNSPKCRLNVTALPTAIAERCRIEPKLLIELLRGEAWRRAELGIVNKPAPSNPSSQPNPSTYNEHENKSWLHRLPNCPPPLLSMLNSRACRSAIMFNDKLSRDECEILVRKLSECAFPFQCAHGRPSMVPLVEVGAGGGREVEVDGEDLGRASGGAGGRELRFGEAWERWSGEAGSGE